MKTRDSFIKIRDKLKKYNEEYYNSNPSIDDSEYDYLKKKYDHLLSKNPELKKYDIHNNKGYGTKKHLNAIKEYGITKWHRKTFGICKEYC